MRMDESVTGVAIAKRTGERRLLTLKEYLELDRVSEARWEFIGFEDDELTPERFRRCCGSSGSHRAGRR